MVFALILVSIGLAVTLGMLLLGKHSPSPAASSYSAAQSSRAPTEDLANQRLIAELEKRKRDWEEQRLVLQDTKEQLKQAKRKLYDNRELGKDSRALSDLRDEYQQLRAELAGALSEIERLRVQRVSVQRPLAEPTPLAPPHAPLAAALPVTASPEREKPQKVYRELNEAEKEKIDRLEQQAAKERLRAAELDRELKRTKGRIETQNRVYLVTKGEFELLKEKFKALEQRNNRTLLETDLLRRAIKDLEIKTGRAADLSQSEPSIDLASLTTPAPEEQLQQST